jgi:hypothetical protein
MRAAERSTSGNSGSATVSIASRPAIDPAPGRRFVAADRNWASR